MNAVRVDAVPNDQVQASPVPKKELWAPEREGLPKSGNVEPPSHPNIMRNEKPFSAIPQVKPMGPVQIYAAEEPRDMIKEPETTVEGRMISK
jgi:hypothetical protein